MGQVAWARSDVLYKFLSASPLGQVFSLKCRNLRPTVNEEGKCSPEVS